MRSSFNHDNRSAEKLDAAKIISLMNNDRRVFPYRVLIDARHARGFTINWKLQSGESRQGIFVLWGTSRVTISECC